MRRIQLVLAALAVAVASFAAISGPAMADDLNCRDAQGDLIRCDGDLYTPYNADNNYYPYYDNNYYPYYDNNDYGLFGPCGLFGVYDPYTGACYDTFGS
jgi:hypothetical protein